MGSGTVLMRVSQTRQHTARPELTAVPDRPCECEIMATVPKLLGEEHSRFAHCRCDARAGRDDGGALVRTRKCCRPLRPQVK